MLRIGQSEKDPASFLAPLDETGIGKNSNVPGDPRLALPQELRQLTHRKLHAREERENAQSRRIGKCLKQLGEWKRFHDASHDI